MNAEVHDIRACEVSMAQAKEELDRLLSDPRFHATERQRAILKYLADRRFSGCDEGVKAYSIAIDVLGRTSGFDASIDPIVRIEVSRLRSAVSNYYEAFGCARGATVHLPKGIYIALFPRAFIAHGPDDYSHDHDGAIAAAGPADAISPVEKEQRHTGAMPGGWWPHGMAALALCIAISAGAGHYASHPFIVARPTVFISMDAADAGLRGEASQTRDMLLTALTQFRTLTVAKQGSPLTRQSGNVYEIDIKYYEDGDDRSVWWQVADGSGDLLKSGVDKIEVTGRTPAAAREELADTLARRFASSRGLISNIETHDSAPDMLGNTCVLRAEYALDEAGADSLESARRCLEATLRFDPGNTDAAATLARVLLAPGGALADTAVKAQALRLASHAVSLAPLSDRAYSALMVAQFYGGRTDAALQAGNRALALNPHNPDVAARLGMVLFLSGYWDAAIALANDAGKAVDVVPREAMLVLALDAYRKGRWSQSSLLAEQLHCADFVVAAVRAASLGQLGSEQARERLADIRTHRPDFERNIDTLMQSRLLQPELAAAIEDGLTKAGADFSNSQLAGAL